MGIAGMVLGIVAVVFGFIPVVGAFIAFPCIAVGLPLAIIGFVRNRKAGQGTGMAISGIATNTVALVIVIVWLAAFGAAVDELSEGPSNFGRPSSLPVAPAFGGIDSSVKTNVGMMGPRPTDGEIRRACDALRRAGWNYMSLDFDTDSRSMMIAASITTFASGDRLVDYCNSKRGGGSSDSGQSGGVAFASVEDCSDIPGQLEAEVQRLTGKKHTPVKGTFKMYSTSWQRDVQMDFIEEGAPPEQARKTATGTLNASDCSWVSLGVRSIN